MGEYPALSIQGIKGALKKGLKNLEEAQKVNKAKAQKIAKENKAYKEILDAKIRTARRQAYAKEVLKHERLSAQMKAKLKHSPKKKQNSFNMDAVVSKEMWDL